MMGSNPNIYLLQEKFQKGTIYFWIEWTKQLFNSVHKEQAGIDQNIKSS